MTDFLNELFESISFMWSDGAPGKVVTVLVLAVLVILAGLVAWGLYALLESAFISTRAAIGTVVKKEYQPETSDYIYIDGIPYPSTSGPSYNLLVETQGEYGWISVTPEFYTKVKVGRQVRVAIGHGRLTGKLQVKQIYG